MKAPKALETQMAGEALFNDGVGVVIFMVLLKLATGDPDAGLEQAALLFAKEAMGGILLGLFAGYLAYQMLKRVDDYLVEVLITLGLVTGGYALASTIHISGPLAMGGGGPAHRKPRSRLRHVGDDEKKPGYLLGIDR